jgi:hypothetical protein
MPLSGACSAFLEELIPLGPLPLRRLLLALDDIPDALAGASGLVAFNVAAALAAAVPLELPGATPAPARRAISA